MHFGKWIREARKAKGLSQREAAERADINPKTWSRVELGHLNYGRWLRRMRRMAAAVGLAIRMTPLGSSANLDEVADSLIALGVHDQSDAIKDIRAWAGRCANAVEAIDLAIQNQDAGEDDNLRACLSLALHHLGAVEPDDGAIPPAAESTEPSEAAPRLYFWRYRWAVPANGFLHLYYHKETALRRFPGAVDATVPLPDEAKQLPRIWEK
jgi:transcriptional regulator with XRE-family HTH domain